MYKAIENFTDLQDNNYAYRVGDIYPREGYSPTTERISRLASRYNKRGRAVIEEIADSSERIENSEAVIAEEDDEKPKRRKRKSDIDEED